MFVAIDRTLKFALVELHEKATTAVPRLKTLKGLTPYVFICRPGHRSLNVAKSAPANAGTEHLRPIPLGFFRSAGAVGVPLARSVAPHGLQRSLPRRSRHPT